MRRQLARAGVAADQGLLVACSGGPDSTALLAAAATLRDAHPRVVAAHCDHRLDEGSRARAVGAMATAAALALECHVIEAPATGPKRTGGGTEADARRFRYAALEKARQDAECDWILTAHHSNDQAETLLIRVLSGSGWPGLAGIAPRHGRILRPLLALDRSLLASAVEETGLAPMRDPTNRDPRPLRNLVRHRLLPRLETEARNGVRRALTSLAGSARAARGAIDRVLAERLRLTEGTASPPSISLEALFGLPHPLWPEALGMLGRRSGRSLPPPSGAVRELRRVLEQGVSGGACMHVDCGAHRRWQVAAGRISDLGPDSPLKPAKSPPFSYNLEVPGAVEIVEISASVRVRTGEVAEWMMSGEPRRTGLVAAGGRWTVRNRRPGDRIRPLGASYDCRLKELLIDRKIPKEERDSIPLLVIENRIAWVPGVTVAEEFRVPASGPVWIAEIDDPQSPPRGTPH